MVFIEDIAASVSAASKFAGALRASQSADRICRSLRAAGDDDHAVILFTSGSERTPKVVPLTHRNLLANLEGLHGALEFGPADIILGQPALLPRLRHQHGPLAAAGQRGRPSSLSRARSSTAPSAPPSAKSA